MALAIRNSMVDHLVMLFVQVVVVRLDQMVQAILLPLPRPALAALATQDSVVLAAQVVATAFPAAMAPNMMLHTAPVAVVAVAVPAVKQA